MPQDLTRRRFLETSLSAALALGCAPNALARPGLDFGAYRERDALGLAEWVRSGEATPAELLDLAIARAEEVDEKINAIVVEHFELARREATGALPDGPLRGVPYLLKDLAISMRGTVTTEGSRFFQDARHETDSTLVERYREAGLVLFGKTHSPEFGSSPSSESTLHGATRNPWDLTRSAGGSSGGSAAAVAAGIVPMAHATDGGGSIRIPASACGLFGLKPTRGRVPMGPKVYEGWGGLSAGHAVSRSVRDSAALMDATQGAAVGDAYATAARERPYLQELEREPGPLRIALMTSPVIPVTVDPDCVAAAQAAAKLCETLGHEVSPASPSLDVEAVWGAFGATTSVGVAVKVAQREAELGRPVGLDDLEPLNHHNVAAGRAISGIEYARARDTLHGASRAVGRFLEHYDVILSPTMALVPPKIGALSLSQPYEDFIGPASRASAFTSLFNITGLPAMSVPLYWTDSGVPVGVMFAGRLGDEATLFRLAAQLETTQPWFDRVPEL
ncbi:MAG: amidase [bacterium]|nr:amidase [Deltaproteobacteria bacterium]MCP4904447.1 amidase [bacterium]